MNRKIKYNQQLLITFWAFINLILFIIFWFNAYFNYPVNNTWGNKIMGSAWIGAGQVFMLNLLLVFMFFAFFYLPYATFKLVHFWNHKLSTKSNKKTVTK